MPRPSFARAAAVGLVLFLGVASPAQTVSAEKTTPLALSPPAAPPGLGDRDEDLDARVGHLVDVFARKGPFSGVVVVARGGKIIAARVAGSADVEHAAPMRLDTPMRLASVTKSLTAAAVLVLRDRGLVELDAPVGRYLPDAPAAWSKVTVRHLLSHRSGLGDFTTEPEYQARQHRPATTAELWKAVVAVPPRGEPGKEVDYHNSNYIVLGALIERVTHRDYDAAMRDLVFQPLGMTGAALDRGEVLVAGRAVGYCWRGRLERAAAVDPTRFGAAGGLRCTAADLVRFAHGLSATGLLKDDSRREMFDSPRDGYGMGFSVGSLGTQRLAGHAGGLDGAATYLGVLPDADLCAVVLSNIELTRATDLGHALLRACTGEHVGDEEVPEPVDYVPPPRVVTADELRRYAGEYQSEMGVLKIAVDGDHLTLHAGGDPSPAALVPGDQPGTFQVHGPGQVRLRFHDDGKGPSRTVELSVRGKVVVGTRGK